MWVFFYFLLFSFLSFYSLFILIKSISSIILDIQPLPLENMSFAHCFLFDVQMFIYSYMYMSPNVS